MGTFVNQVDDGSFVLLQVDVFALTQHCMYDLHSERRPGVQILAEGNFQESRVPDWPFL